MRVLVSWTVEKEVFKIFSSLKLQEVLFTKISEQTHNIIYIKRPYIKIKLRIFSSSLRIVARYFPEEDLLILLFVLKKTDKNFWENIYWDKDTELRVIQRNERINSDIKKSNYKLYPSWK